MKVEVKKSTAVLVKLIHGFITNMNTSDTCLKEGSVGTHRNFSAMMVILKLEKKNRKKNRKASLCPVVFQMIIGSKSEADVGGYITMIFCTSKCWSTVLLSH